MREGYEVAYLAHGVAEGVDAAGWESGREAIPKEKSSGCRLSLETFLCDSCP